MLHVIKIVGIILGSLLLTLGAVTAIFAWYIDKLLRSLFPDAYR